MAGESRVRAPRVARGALVLMAAGAAFVGVPATVAPRGFYDNFPFVASWVENLPPYNEHLVTDVGGLYLALAVIAAWAAWTLSVPLIRAVCAGWLVSALLHFAFHARHLEDYGTFDAIAQTASLGLYILLPLIALWGARIAAEAPRGGGSGDAPGGRPRPPDDEPIRRESPGPDSSRGVEP